LTIINGTREHFSNIGLEYGCDTFRIFNLTKLMSFNVMVKLINTINFMVN